MGKIIDVLKLKIKLKLKLFGNIVAFDIPSIGEWQFIRPVVLRYSMLYPGDLIILVHHGINNEKKFKEIAPKISKCVIHAQNNLLRSVVFSEIDLFITTEQYNGGLDGVYSVCMFHGHAGKGLSFVPEIVSNFDAFFMLGPVHREAFDYYLQDFEEDIPLHLHIFDVGYPKSDDLINGLYSHQNVLQKLLLGEPKKTILYAPAFNEGASLREYGLEIINLLSGLKEYNIIVKLPIDCREPLSNFYATGGVDWFGEVRKLETVNLKLYEEDFIDPVLACADVLITDISTVSFEFLALNKPVIFINTPKYYSGFLKNRFPNKDVESWSHRNIANGGKEFGPVVDTIQDLPGIIKDVFDHPGEFPLHQDKLKTYLLYNRGKGTEAAVDKIKQLVTLRVKTNRVVKIPGLIQNIYQQIQNIYQQIQNIYQQIFIHGLNFIKRILNQYGYTLQKVGGGYHDPQELVKLAGNLSLCEYLEKRDNDTRKMGRRDRIIDQMKQLPIPENSIILEIGAGTGMYLEKVLPMWKPKRYEVYETNHGWVNYLKSNYQNCVYYISDGETLKDTSSDSCDLVHAHGVFVYIPVLQSFSYIKEAARVLVSGGYLVFDCYLDGFDINAWISSEWRFPVIIPEKILMNFTNQHGLKFIRHFREIHGASFVDYLVFRKMGDIK